MRAHHNSKCMCGARHTHHEFCSCQGRLWHATLHCLRPISNTHAFPTQNMHTGTAASVISLPVTAIAPRSHVAVPCHPWGEEIERKHKHRGQTQTQQGDVVLKNTVCLFLKVARSAAALQPARYQSQPPSRSPSKRW